MVKSVYSFIFHNIRIFLAHHAIQDKGDQRATTVMKDLLLTRAECSQQLVLDRMERISSLSKVSTRKHDHTHRKWFNDILTQSYGVDAFNQVALDMSSGKLKHAKERRCMEE